MTPATDRRPSALLLALLALPLGIAACPKDPRGPDVLDGLTDAGADDVVIDATNETEWAYFSFAQGKVVTVTDASTSSDWDIAFRRYNIKTNGGTSGPGQGAAADLGDKALETTTTATVSGWTEDEEVADARTGEQLSMNSLLSGWYDYHFIKHQLISKYRLYAIRTADGKTALLKIYDYYDASGTGGFVTITYRYPVGAEEVQTDGGTDTPDAGAGEVLPDTISTDDGVVHGEVNVDARALSYLQFTGTGVTTQAADFEGAWDLRFDLWLLRTNGGTSGTAQGASEKATETFEAATTAPADGWIVDTVQTIGAEQRQESTNDAFAGWFEYDTTTQKIASKGETYWLKTHDGKYAKFQIVGYYHPVSGEQGFFRLKFAYRADGGTDFDLTPAP